MPVKQLIVMVEGPSDKYYFEKYLDVVCSNYTCKVYMWNHPNLEGRKTPDTEKIINYINSGIHLRKNDMGDYLFVTDIDASTCVTKKKSEIKKRFKNLEDNRILIIVKEIESWYLAGLDKLKSEELGIPYFTNTNSISKEDYLKIIPEGYDELDFRIIILDNYNITLAKNKNKSLHYFTSKNW